MQIEVQQMTKSSVYVNADPMDFILHKSKTTSYDTRADVFALPHKITETQ